MSVTDVMTETIEYHPSFHAHETADFPVRTSSKREPWAVVLAGGDGVRLRSLSKFISGDDRPKQFCPILGDKSLLSQTRSRISGMIKENKTLFVVTKSHEPYYKDELRDVPPGQMIVQPANKGTAAAIALSLLRIVSRDPGAVVAFFPSDHFYHDENRFRASISSALQTAGELPCSIILVGAEATHPETEYGWIEPGSIPAWDTSCRFHRVRRFWEKPSADAAAALHRDGCLWNTFVMVGRASAFLQLLQSTVPELLGAFASAEWRGKAEDAYLREDFKPVDFSRSVLARCTDQVLVVRLPSEAGWSDLGAPERVMKTLEHVGIEPRHMPLRAWYSIGSAQGDSVTSVA